MSEQATYAVCPKDGKPCTPQRFAACEYESCPLLEDSVREVMAVLMAEHRETCAKLAGR